ncbi:MAG: CheR family methyltransferase [Planctomycetota bacterium]
MERLSGADLLRWALPRLRMRWAGFRKVRRQVVRRVRRRARELGLEDLAAYQSHLESDPDEWAALDACCRVTVSRFYRDAHVWDRLREEISGRREVRAWCAGAGSGEEPYTLAMLCRAEGVEARLLATDPDARLLDRAREGRYPRSTLKELPPDWLARYFESDGGLHVLRPDLRAAVEWRIEDLRASMPDGPFDLVLCRNLAFTYYEESLQREVLTGLRERVRPGGLLVIGRRERLPEPGLFEVASGIHRREP